MILRGVPEIVQLLSWQETIENFGGGNSRKGRMDQPFLMFYLRNGMAGARADAHRLETLHKRMGMEAFPGKHVF
jgi:hypothetical protein